MGQGETLRVFLAAVLTELRWRAAAALGLAIALALTEGAGLLLLVPLLAAVGLANEGASTSRLSAEITFVFQTVGLQPTLPIVLAIFLVSSAAYASLSWVNVQFHPALEQRFVLALRRRLYGSLVRAEWSFFIRHRSSDLVHALNAEIDRVGSSAYQLLTFITGSLVSIVYITIALRISPPLTMSVGVAGVFLLWTMRHRIARSREKGQEYIEADRRQFNLATDSLAGLKVAKTFAAEDRDLALFEMYSRDRAGTYLSLVRAFADGRLRLDLVSGFVISGLLLVAVEYWGLRGAGLLLLVFIFARVMPRMIALQQSAEMVSGGLPAYARVADLIRDCEVHSEQLQNEDTQSRLTFRRELALEAVSFAYEPGGPNALRDVTLAIQAGHTVAIVGGSGAGKSTLADLIIGLLRPANGRVVIDGKTLGEKDVAAWRRSVGYIPQETFLLPDTIRRNFLWAKPDATDAQMWEALARAGAADFVRARPDGLDTMLGDRGVRLSGGERQRVALARTLLIEPPLLILDEATSALDAVVEQQILMTLRSLKGRLTTVIITHRLSAVTDADLIYVIEKGALVDRGTWETLVARDGVFARLVRAQARDDAVSRSENWVADRELTVTSGRATAIHGQ
jgi:ATP-binding cassette subfamily C protein